MSVQDRTTRDAHERALFDQAMSPPSATISRRSAIRTGGLAAIAASLLGATHAKPAEAAAVPATGALVDMSALVADSKRAVEAYNAGDEAVTAAFLKIRAALSEEHYALFHEHSSAAFQWSLQTEELLLAELCRHLPGFSTTIRAIVAHIESERAETGVCCLPGSDDDAG